MKRSIRASLGLVSLLAIALAYRPAAVRISLYRLEHGNPEADADAALARGDSGLVAIELLRIHVPGADSVLGMTDAIRCKLRFIPYGSDLVTPFNTRYNGAAFAYAAAYNHRLLAKAGHCAIAAAA